MTDADYPKQNNGTFDMKHFNSTKDCLNYIQMEFPETLEQDHDLLGGDDLIADVRTLLDGIAILSGADRDTIIAALRLWQLATNEVWRENSYASFHGSPLINGEIDDLCERIDP